MRPGVRLVGLTGPAVACVLVLGASACSRLPADAQERFDRAERAVGDGDYAEAYWWWRPLAEAGMAEAQYHLGWLYANGNGLRVNLPEAIRWWSIAADLGHQDAGFSIGMAFLNGEPKSLDRDFPQALVWLRRAGDHGQEDAQEVLTRRVRTETEQVLSLQPGILADTWLGPSVRVSVDKSLLRDEPGSNKSVAGEGERDQVLKKIDERNGWLLVVDPADERLVWLRGSDADPSELP